MFLQQDLEDLTVDNAEDKGGITSKARKGNLLFNSEEGFVPSDGRKMPALDNGNFL